MSSRTTEPLNRGSLRADGAGAIMFGGTPDEVADAEIRDVVGELTNITGGNVKALVGGTCQLSLPAVTEGADYLMSLPGTDVVNRVRLDCDGELLLVTVLERRQAA